VKNFKDKIIKLKMITNKSNQKAIIFLLILLVLPLIYAQNINEDHNKYLENIDDFIALENTEKNNFWTKLNSQQKNNIFNELKGSKGYDFNALNIDHSDLTWEGNKFGVKEGDTLKAWIDFDKLPKDITEVKYISENNEKKFLLKRKERNLGFDKGTIEEDGKNTKHILPNVETPIFLNYGEKGDIEYDSATGEYKVSNGAWLKIGNNFYTSENENPAFVKLEKANFKIEKAGLLGFGSSFEDKEKDLISAKNARVLITEIDKETNKEKTSAVVRTSKEKYVAIIGDEKLSDYAGPYAQIDLKNKNINMEGGDTNSYIKTSIFTDFNEVNGKGDNLLLANGNSELRFYTDKNTGKGKIYKDRRVLKSTLTSKAHNIDKITNLNNPEKSYGWKKVEDSQGNTFYDLYDYEQRVRFNNGMTTAGKKARPVSGTFVETDKQYQEGYFKGTEEERIEALTADDDTTLDINFYRKTSGSSVAVTMKEGFEAGLIETNIQLEAKFDKSNPGWRKTKENGEWKSGLAFNVAGGRPVKQILSQENKDGIAIYDAQESGELNNLFNTIANQGNLYNMRFTGNKLIINNQLIETKPETIELIKAFRNQIISNPQYQHYRLIQGLKETKRLKNKYYSGYLNTQLDI